MPCYHPLQGWRASQVNSSGKRSIVFNPELGFKDLPVEVPCGQCVGCRLERSRQWAMRITHEASLYDDNCFITLTYNDDHLPEGGSLCVDHFQKFMKRLRKKFSGQTIRFFHCGEYGDKYGRPHYHAILFNIDFPDKVFLQKRGDNTLFTSDILNSLWPFGFSSIGAVTFESAAYCARYIMKKITGDLSKLHYSDIDYATGEIIHTRKPEYTTMSRRPGIASGWFEQFHGDVYPKDFVTVRGKKMTPPKFYDSMFELVDPKGLQKIKHDRKMKAAKHSENNTPERLAIRKKVKLSQIKSLKRDLEL